MHPNALLITRFYTAFKNKDYKTMQSCYANNATFTDEAFVNLDATQVRAMWQMLITTGKDLELNFKNVTANDTHGSAEWVATYTFSKTGNRVVNHIKAEFTFANGLIVSHRDYFNFYTWVMQALGLPGLLLGWSNFMKNKVQQTAAAGLKAFMQKGRQL